MSTLVIQQNPEEKRRIGIAFIFSVVVHLLLLLLVLAYMTAGGYFRAASPPKSNSIEMIFVDPAQNEPIHVDTTASQQTDTAPENAPFQSDKNTKAASETAAQGTIPLPSQEGVENKSLEFENQQYTVGTQPQQAAPPAAPSQPQKPQPEQLAEQTPPQPQQNINEVQPNSIALLDAPVNKAVKEKKPIPESPANPTADRPGYQPQTRVTRIKGGINNRGRSAVDAASTPLGRYKKMLSDAIGTRWYYYVDKRLDLFSIGTVQIQFVVNSDGNVHGCRVLSNTSNESFATSSMQSIMDAKIPPIPPDVAETLAGQSLEVDFTFSIISN